MSENTRVRRHAFLNRRDVCAEPLCAPGPRIALSFNLLGPASSEEARIDPAAAMGIPDWELLADSTAVMGGG